MIPKVSFLITAHNIAPFIQKLLDSIPWSNSIEVIARSNGSTDKTVEILSRYRDEHPSCNLKVVVAEDSCAAENFNALLELATGEYIQFVDGDDYLYPEKYKHIIARMDGVVDCVYTDLVINSGDIWKLTPSTRIGWCAPFTRAFRREFAKGAKFPEDRIADSDWFFNQELLKRNPVSVFTGIPAYHYNFPRKGSMMDLLAKGIIKEKE